MQVSLIYLAWTPQKTRDIFNVYKAIQDHHKAHFHMHLMMNTEAKFPFSACHYPLFYKKVTWHCINAYIIALATNA